MRARCESDGLFYFTASITASQLMLKVQIICFK